MYADAKNIHNVNATTLVRMRKLDPTAEGLSMLLTTVFYLL